MQVSTISNFQIGQGISSEETKKRNMRTSDNQEAMNSEKKTDKHTGIELEKKINFIDQPIPYFISRSVDDY